jgi:hypothetical protein
VQVSPLWHDFNQFLIDLREYLLSHSSHKAIEFLLAVSYVMMLIRAIASCLLERHK